MRHEIMFKGMKKGFLNQTKLDLMDSFRGSPRLMTNIGRLIHLH